MHGNAVSRVNRSSELYVHIFNSDATSAEHQLLSLTVADMVRSCSVRAEGGSWVKALLL